MEKGARRKSLSPVKSLENLMRPRTLSYRSSYKITTNFFFKKTERRRLKLTTLPSILLFKSAKYIVILAIHSTER